MSEWHGSLRSRSWSSFFTWFWVLGLFSQQVSPFFISTCELDTDTGQESVPHGSHRSCLVTLSLDTGEDVMGGEVDELEEDVG